MQSTKQFRFGGMAQSISGQLFPKLNQQGITPEQLFSIPNINGDIRQNIQKFFAFCTRKRQFTVRMFQLCFNSDYQQLNDENKKKVAQYTIEALSSDEDALSQFLFSCPHHLQNTSQVSQNIDGELQQNIETEAQRLFGDDSPKSGNFQWEKQPQVFEKFQLVKLSLAHLQKTNVNQTCLGYIHKVYSSILRRQGKCLLEFFKENECYLDLLFEKLKYPSVSNIIALSLSSEDKSGEYQFEQLKLSIFKKLLQYAFQNMGDSQKFEGYMLTVEQILNSTKQSYYQYFQDFKRCANVLVSEQTLTKFYEEIKSQKQQNFANSIWYLELILKRITNEDDDNDYYRQHENTQPTMKFEHQFLFAKYDELTDFLEKSSRYSSLTRVNFLGFLLSLIKLQKNNEGVVYSSIFIKILKFYMKEEKPGMIKNYLYLIMETIIKKASSEEIEKIAEHLLSQNIIEQQYRKRLGSSKINKNNDAVTCFFLSILFNIQNRKKGFLVQTNPNFKQALMQMYEVYKTKLADQVQDNFFQLEFMLPKKFEQNVNFELKSFQKEAEKQTYVGRNNILIPSLNLTNKIQNAKVFIQEEQVEQINLPQQPTRQSIIQDLKNTIIQLPQKFKAKKNDRKEEKIQIEVKKNNPERVIEGIGQIEQRNKKEDLEKIEEFYVKHLILF